MPIQFITPSIISSVANTQVTGTITASQIATVNASTVTTGTLPGARLPAGSVLQVVQNTYSTQVSLSSTTYTDNGLTATITPVSSTSKILVLISQNLYIYRDFAFQYGYIRLLKNVPSVNTVVIDFAQVMNQTAGNPAGGSYPYHDMQAVISLSYLDSPATTSAITYKTQHKCGTTSDNGTVISQIAGSPSIMTLLEIAA